MRFSVWATLPLYAATTSALVIPNAPSLNDAVAGSIARPNITEAAGHTISILELEHEKLEALKHRLFELHHEIFMQEHEILALINRDFKSCSGVKCYLQTALRKAPDFFQLFKTHFRHHPKNATAGAWDCPWERKSSKEAPLSMGIAESAEDSMISLAEDSIMHFDEDSSLPPSSPPMDVSSSAFNEDWFPLPPPPASDEASHSVSPGDPPRPGWHADQYGRPQSNDQDYKPWNQNPNVPAAHPHHKGHHAFHMPHPAPRSKHFKLILATAGGVVSVLILATLLKALKVYLANPRVQADRAARIEECRTRREYRRAACEHRFRQCLSRFGRRGRSSDDTGDYEEKRTILQRANDFNAADHIMGADINSLRRAHEIVGQLMRAEEGRTHNCPPFQQQAETQRLEQESIASSSRSVRSLHTTTTLPPYAPPPPRYSQELSRDMEVVDGFRYTPSQSDATVTSSASSFILNDDDLCTESSVVDCRSRMSMETDDRPSHKQSLELAGDRFRGQYD